MKRFLRILSPLEKFLDRLLCVLGAILFSQAPEFMQQYLQRLGGHLDEARRIVGNFTRAAAEHRLSLPAYIDRAALSPDPVAQSLSRVMSESLARADTLAAAEQSLRDSTPFSRPFHFLQHLDTDIAAATWHIYKPAVPVTIEGLIYALLGILLAIALYHLIKLPLQKLLSKQKPNNNNPTTGTSTNTPSHP